MKAHPKLLVSGVWCIADIEYEHSEDKNVSPWILGSIKPIQLSKFDFDGYLEARAGFTTDEWIDLLFQTVGFDPEMFGRRSKLLQLMRLVPFVERNYNLIELGPKGTGKSHIFSEFSPHGILISGGEVTVPKLFVNNSSGKIGLVGYWDVVAFDEFAGRQKRVDKALVDIMKNYMANKSFSRGVETLGAEASMVFVGNTQHNVPYMLKHSDLFDELPEKYYDSAFIDRLHTYMPGWEIDVIRGEMFASGYGFVVDYLAEILGTCGTMTSPTATRPCSRCRPDISTRDRDGVNKTFSGTDETAVPSGQRNRGRGGGNPAPCRGRAETGQGSAPTHRQHVSGDRLLVHGAGWTQDQRHNARRDGIPSLLSQACRRPTKSRRRRPMKRRIPAPLPQYPLRNVQPKRQDPFARARGT